MSVPPSSHPLGRIDTVHRPDAPALSRDVELRIAAVQEAWPAFEGAFDSLRGRRMLGLVHDADGVYRMSSLRLERDEGNPLALAETVVPGGSYLRLRLRGEAPAVYGRIGEAFDVLLGLAERDPARPLIEDYRREGEVDCLVPVLPSR